MIYSCFNPNVGLYDYFQDSKELPINADLPIPKMPSMAGKIGVPAIDAGRPLPGDAQRTGQGWHARGMIVQCGRGSGMSGFGSLASLSMQVEQYARPIPIAIAGTGLLAGYFIGKSVSKNKLVPIAGAAVGAVAAVFGMLYVVGMGAK